MATAEQRQSHGWLESILGLLQGARTKPRTIATTALREIRAGVAKFTEHEPRQAWRGVRWMLLGKPIADRLISETQQNNSPSYKLCYDSIVALINAVESIGLFFLSPLILRLIVTGKVFELFSPSLSARSNLNSQVRAILVGVGSSLPDAVAIATTATFLLSISYGFYAMSRSKLGQDQDSMESVGMESNEGEGMKNLHWLWTALLVVMLYLAAAQVFDAVVWPENEDNPGQVDSLRLQTHIVQPGETLSGIAANYGVSVNDLAGYNGIANLDQIRSGQVLTIPRKVSQ